ncbi:zinc ribbon domain-containing protein [Nitrososphaera sp.]|uniref:zinc ribbon domain-containing protein n=1 Tax=Nitrososphaera sp. TaxID=1971748 RepID=UPI0025D1F1F4|nr:zinc ribbon domain-containing protein [Nitrososphaera sp.]
MSQGRLIIDQKLVKKLEYSIDEALDERNEEIKGANKLVIYPIELGNLIQVERKDGAALFSSRLSECQVEAVTETKGRFKKSEDLWLRITSASQGRMAGEVRVNVKDKEINEILNQITIFRALEKDYWKTIEIFYYNKGELTSTKVPVRAPVLAEGETLLWSHIQTKGIINKQADLFAAITTFRAFVYDFQEHDCGRIFLPGVDEVIVTDQHRVSESNSGGMYSRGRYGAGVYSGSSSGTSHTVGKVSFIADGKPIVTFGPVADPHGLARLAKAAVKDIKEAYKELEKRAKSTEKETPTQGETMVEIPAATQSTVVEQIICPSCKNSVAKGSNFCNNCGAKLQFICSKCGNNNPENSKFCNSCGFTLG